MYYVINIVTVTPFPFNYYTVPNRTLDDAQTTPLPSGDTGFSVTLRLLQIPSPYTPNDLVIISFIDPPDDGPIVENYPMICMSTQQYTVAFSGLRPGIEYEYNIQVALRTDNTTVGLPVTGNHVIITGTGELLSLTQSKLILITYSSYRIVT